MVRLAQVSNQTRPAAASSDVQVLNQLFPPPLAATRQRLRRVRICDPHMYRLLYWLAPHLSQLARPGFLIMASDSVLYCTLFPAAVTCGQRLEACEKSGGFGSVFFG